MNADQIKAKFPGYGGWNDRAAIEADFKATGGAGKGPSAPSSSSYSTPASSAPSAPAFDVEGFLAKQKAEGEALRAKQAKEEEALFQTFQTKATAQPKLTSIYDTLLTEQGIPGLQQTVSTVKGEIFNIKDLIDRLEADVTARTSGTLTTDAQRRRMVTAEREPLSANLGRLATGLTPTVEALQTAQENVGTRLALTSKEQEKELEPERMRIAATSDRFARETTGYTQDRQDSLTFLLNKIQADQALSQREWQAAQELAKSEREWENKKKELELTSANAIKLKQTPEPAKPGSTVSNPYLGAGTTTTVGGGKTSDPLNIFGTTPASTKSVYGDILNVSPLAAFGARTQTPKVGGFTVGGGYSG